MKYWKVNDDFIDISDSFIYEVDLYYSDKNGFYLKDTKNYLCDEFIDSVVSFSYLKGDSFGLHKFTTLISAPLHWLEMNASIVEYETPSEKRKRKKLEKENNLKLQVNVNEG